LRKPVAVDLNAQKAQLIGNIGASDLYVTRGDGSINFIEQTPSGNLVVTTIIDPDKNGKIRAVGSRHMVLGAIGMALLSADAWHVHGEGMRPPRAVWFCAYFRSSLR
jgi:hypothetical protein